MTKHTIVELNFEKYWDMPVGEQAEWIASVLAWINENSLHNDCAFDTLIRRYVKFKNEEDAIAFKLKFGL